jgi:hypothetical protein
LLLHFSLYEPLLLLLPSCSLWKWILIHYLLTYLSTCSLLLNPADHSAVVVESANQLLQENWLREKSHTIMKTSARLLQVTECYLENKCYVQLMDIWFEITA